MRRGDIKAEAYARALLSRAAEQDGLNAFITFDHEAVLEATRAADRAREAGKALGLLRTSWTRPGPSRGPSRISRCSTGW